MVKKPSSEKKNNMAYRCINCQSITNDIDSPTCPNTCSTFRPTRITITHLTYKVNNVDIIACLGIPNNTVKSIHRLGVVNCKDCIEASKEIIAEMKAKYNAVQDAKKPKPLPKPEQKPEEPQIVYLSQLGLPDTLIEKLQVWAVDLDNMELMTYDGFFIWNETNELINIPNLNSEDLELLQLILKR